MKQSYENIHAVNVNNNIFNGNITTINHFHISTVTPNCHYQRDETIQNDLQLDQSNTIARDLLDLAPNLMLQHVHCQRSRGDDSSYEGDCNPNFAEGELLVGCFNKKIHVSS
jgi:hypothetical protein